MDKPVQFPANHIEALALVSAVRTSGNAMTPENLCKKYWEAYYRIAAVDEETRREAAVKSKP